MTTLQIALLQIDAAGADVEANTAIAEAACREAKALGADLAVMPEIFSVGYRFPGDDDLDEDGWRARAEPADGPWVTWFGRLAAELDMAIAATYLEAVPGVARPRNTVTLLNHRGDAVLTYAKVHTCEFDVERLLEPGDGFRVVTLDTAAGPVEVGAMICYDREFPEAARALMLGGAELIVTPNACEIELNRWTQLRSRAFENMTAIAVANYPNHGGRSALMDGVAFTEEDGPTRDMCVVEAGAGREIAAADLDLGLLREYRAHETLANAYRRPRLYGAMIDEVVQAPFVRDDATR